MIIIIALLLLALCIGLLLGRKATLILICVIYAMGHWGSAKAATDADIAQDVKLMEQAGSFHMQHLLSGTPEFQLMQVETAQVGIQAYSRGQQQLLAGNLFGSAKVRTIQKARREASEICSFGHRLFDSGNSLSEFINERPTMDAQVKVVLKFCFTEAFLEALHEKLDY